jgi:hypothetical protein
VEPLNKLNDLAVLKAAWVYSHAFLQIEIKQSPIL